MGHKSNLPVVKHDIYVKHEFCSNDKSFSNVFHLGSHDIIHQITRRKLFWLKRLWLRLERNNQDKSKSEDGKNENDNEKVKVKMEKWKWQKESESEDGRNEKDKEKSES